MTKEEEARVNELVKRRLNLVKQEMEEQGSQSETGHSMTKAEIGYSMASVALWYAAGYIDANRRVHNCETHGQADFANERYRLANATRYYCAMGLEQQVSEWMEEFGGDKSIEARLAAARRMNNAANQIVERGDVTFIALYDLTDAIINSFGSTAQCVENERRRIAALRSR